jgi:hypothetical protein
MYIILHCKTAAAIMVAGKWAGGPGKDFRTKFCRGGVTKNERMAAAQMSFRYFTWKLLIGRPRLILASHHHTNNSILRIWHRSYYFCTLRL